MVVLHPLLSFPFLSLLASVSHNPPLNLMASLCWVQKFCQNKPVTQQGPRGMAENKPHCIVSDRAWTSFRKQNFVLYSNIWYNLIRMNRIRYLCMVEDWLWWRSWNTVSHNLVKLGWDWPFTFASPLAHAHKGASIRPLCVRVYFCLCLHFSVCVCVFVYVCVSLCA